MIDEDTFLRAVDELLHQVGKVLLEEGEAWRLNHAELLDAFEVLSNKETEF